MPMTIDPEPESIQKYQTVDNLSTDVNKRYIEGTALLNERELQQVIKTPNIAAKAEILTTTPKHQEIDLLLRLQQRESSPFIEPPGFVLTNNVFTHALIPSIGSAEDLIKKLEPLKTEGDSAFKKQLKTLQDSFEVIKKLDEMLKIVIKNENEFLKG